MISALLIFLAALCTIYYLIGLYNEMYWKRRGVKFYKKHKVFGPMMEFITSDRPSFKIFSGIYEEFANEPAVGVGSFLTPALYVKDPANVNFVLQQEFSSFNHRGFEVNEDDKLANNVLFMNGNKWKLMRQSLTPLFTSSKLKRMYYILDQSAGDFVNYLKQRPEKLKGNMFDTICTFCSAAVGASVFGITTNSVFDSPFLKMAQNASKSTTSVNIKFAMSSLNRTLFKLLGIKIFKEHEDFFIGAIKQVIRNREQEKVKRHDFADICVALQSNGILKDHDTGLELQPTDELLAAQAFFFFVAGVEPCATTIFFTLIELGRNPKELERVLAEIDEVFEKHGNNMTYDVVQGMEYLDMVINEATRMYPPIGNLTRECIRDTVLPVGNIKVDKGTKLFTPIYDIHHDPKIFPEPEVFKPERFSPENRGAFDNLHMAFGKGNRLCIGVRYATLQVKSGLLHLLRHFSVKTYIHGDKIEFSKENLQVRAKNASVELIPRSSPVK